ncbi:MAG TPA: FG-GAP-like repeat-containing protein [Gammaproteobacteria bacterium]|nr:FG-GAP-like repeat-containing protein [Gammaproteobacteria bacterium]
MRTTFTRTAGAASAAILQRAAVVLAAAILGAGTAWAGTSTVTALPGSVTVTGPAATTLQFPVERAGADVSYDAWLTYQTANGTGDDAAIAGKHYTAASGVVKLPANQTATVNVPVSVLGSRYPLSDKTLKLNVDAVGAGPAPTFAAAPTITDTAVHKDLAFADFNVDGKQDLLILSGDSVFVRLNDTPPGGSAPSFESAMGGGLGATLRSVTAADINGDARPDLIVAITDPMVAVAS